MAPPSSRNLYKTLEPITAALIDRFLRGTIEILAAERRAPLAVRSAAEFRIRLMPGTKPRALSASLRTAGAAAASRTGTAIHEEALKRTLAARGLKATVPGTIATQTDAERWLASQAKDEAARPALIDAYRGQLRTVVDELSRRIAGRVSEIRTTLDQAGLDVLPAVTRSWPWQDWAHFFGVLVTCAMLSLGAPFWFNLLKNLMSLRPAVANLIEKRPTSAPALPATPATPTSSS